MVRPASPDYPSVTVDGIVFRLYPGRRYFVGYADGRKLALHRYLYERHHGPIPEGWHVHHADGDPANNDPGNLVALDPRRHHEAHANDDRGVDRPCDYCGVIYHAGRKARVKWCSSSCRDRDRRRLGVYAEDRVCAVCGAGFRVADRSDTGRTCSRGCAERLRHEDRACEWCGESFVARRPWARFCSGACKQRAAKARRADVEPDRGGCS